MSDPVLALSGIEKFYHRGKPAEICVLRGLDISVARGEVVALVAPSGAGKSTLLHIAGLLDTPDGGRISIDGRDMSGQSDRVRTGVRRADLGFVYQFRHLLPEFSAAEMAKFREKMKPVVDKHAAHVGPEVVKALQAELAKVRK